MADPDSRLKAMGIDVSGSSVKSSGAGGIDPNTKIYLSQPFNRNAYGGGTGFNRGAYGQSPGPYAPKTDFGTGTNEMSYQQAQLAPLGWTDAEKRDFISKGILYKLPGFNADMGMPEIMSNWDDLVKSSAAFSQGGKPWTPWDVMDSYGNSDKNFGTIRKGDWLYDAATGEKLKYVGPKTKTTTDKKIDLSSAEDVKAITTQMLTELLGRAPTSKELAQYRSSINGYERDNPLVTKTTSHLDDQGEITSQEATSSGGATDAARQSMIQDTATKGPEYGKYQSGTTYYNALMQMLGG